MKAIKFLTVALVALISVNAFAGLTKDTRDGHASSSLSMHKPSSKPSPMKMMA